MNTFKQKDGTIDLGPCLVDSAILSRFENPNDSDSVCLTKEQFLFLLRGYARSSTTLNQIDFARHLVDLTSELHYKVKSNWKTRDCIAVHETFMSFFKSVEFDMGLNEMFSPKFVTEEDDE